MSEQGRVHFLGWAQAFIESSARILAVAESLEGPAVARVLEELRDVAERQKPLPADEALYTITLECLSFTAAALAAGDEPSLRAAAMTLRGAEGLLAATVAELGLD